MNDQALRELSDAECDAIYLALPLDDADGYVYLPVQRITLGIRAGYKAGYKAGAEANQAAVDALRELVACKESTDGTGACLSGHTPRLHTAWAAACRALADRTEG